MLKKLSNPPRSLRSVIHLLANLKSISSFAETPKSINVKPEENTWKLEYANVYEKRTVSLSVDTSKEAPHPNKASLYRVKELT